MGKEGETKKQILELLGKKGKTLSDLSRDLGLAPSTVSQHLHELLENGAIRELDKESTRKWKYYVVNENAEAVMLNRKDKVFASALAIFSLAVLAALILYMNYSTYTIKAMQLSPNSTVPVGTTVFSVSDAPPQYNITAVYLTIKEIYLRSYSTGRLYKVNSNATVELVGLSNISKVISTANVPNGIYNEIILNISSASAIVNGTQERVFLPTGMLRIFDIVNISQNTTNWVNIDFNLAKSLHILENGTIVMFPVINMEHMRGCVLGLNQSRIIVVRSRGMLINYVRMGMSQNGSMLRNFSMPGNMSITIGKAGKIAATPSNVIQIAIWNNKWLAIQNIAGRLIQSSFNITIKNSGNSTIPNTTTGMQNFSMNCQFWHGGIYCSLPTGAPLQNTIKIKSKIFSILNNSTMMNISKTIANISVSNEFNRVIGIDPNATMGMFSCNATIDCVAVPTFVCRNGLPYQSACINSAYESTYMSSYYVYFQKNARYTMCPMFIVNTPIKCACINDECIETYNTVHPIPMPTPR